ncbi:MAG: hypothetical protein ACREMI_01560, partial [Gemmatimonadales bacterium]
ETTAAPWHEAGYRVEYRQFYPHLTRGDLARYRAVIILGGREPQGPSDALTIGDLAILTEWIGSGRDGVVVLGYRSDGTGRGKTEDGTQDRWVMNQWLAAQGAGITLGAEHVDEPASPQPHSALDNAGFAPFAAGRNHALQVRDRSQTLARAPVSALVAASRVDEGLIVVVSRGLLAAGSGDAHTRDFLEALARWTRRPAEWAGVRAAKHPAALRLAEAPLTVAVHPPPLVPPIGAAAVPLPQPESRDLGDSMTVSGWLARQGMRVLWTRFTPQALDSLLAFVDLAALNALATTIPVPALADTIGTRNIWRVTAERMQATSVRWFPAVSLVAIPSEGADEVNRHGDLTPMPCGLDSVFWRGALRPTYRTLARLGGARPEVITGVAVDLDSAMTLYRGSGFCDADYRAGLAALGLDSAETARLAALPPPVRYDTLLERGWLSRYFEALQAAVGERAAALRAELHRLHPDLRFAFHATEPPGDWFSIGLLRGFSTRDVPALLWLRERRGGTSGLLRHYRDKGIYALAAVGLDPDRATFAPGETARLRPVVFGENDGFWLTGAATDSLGRVIRRFVK